jgi:hypothetical protein
VSSGQSVLFLAKRNRYVVFLQPTELPMHAYTAIMIASAPRSFPAPKHATPKPLAETIQAMAPLRLRTPNLSRLRSYPTSASLLSLLTTSTCPSPTCPCAATPPDLDIDRVRPLNNTMAPYTQHLAICTGQRDWTSRIEDDGADTGWGELGRGVKRMMSAREGGEFVDVS